MSSTGVLHQDRQGRKTDAVDASLADAVAERCHAQYRALPTRGAKPIRRTDGRREWTILSGLLLRITPTARPVPNSQVEGQPELHLIALATGVKCSPLDKISPQGDLLHDCHAEVLTRRLARRWFLRRLSEEVRLLRQARSAGVSGRAEEELLLDDLPLIFEPVEGGEHHWRLRAAVQVVWYISTLPCGDASTAQLLSSRSERFPSQAPSVQGQEEATRTVAAVARGRANQTLISTLRTKPGRADCLPALSHSCSDKLARYNFLGLQGAQMSSLVEPIVPSAFVIGFTPQGQADIDEQQQAERLRQECKRALWDRVAAFASSSTSFGATTGRGHPDVLLVANPDFEHFKETVERQVRAEQREDEAWEDIEPVPAAGSLLWTRLNASKGIVESVVAGLKMGASSIKKKGQEHLPLHPSRRSTICKLNWYLECQRIRDELRPQTAETALSEDVQTYFSAKHDSGDVHVRRYQHCKRLLQGWARDNPGWTESPEQRDIREAYERDAVRAFIANDGALSKPVGDAAKGAPPSVSLMLGTEAGMPNIEAPFYGWLVSGRAAESFDLNGTIPAGPSGSTPDAWQ